jgi:VanZ family protein
MDYTSRRDIRNLLSIAMCHIEPGLEYKNILRLLWLGAAGLVAMFSLLPASSPPLKAMIHGDDKLEHFAAYAVLTFLPSLHERPKILICIALAVMAMGIGLEFGQLLSEGRRFEVEDMVADSYGLLAGIIVGLPSRFWFQRKRGILQSEPRV